MESGGFLSERARPTPALTALSGLEIGPYRLAELVGRGGMGTVWQAERTDGRFDQRVAIKALNAGFVDASGRERFAREASILARLTHPSISHVIDAGVSDYGAPYLVLEYVEGRHIDRHCDERRLDLTDRLYLFLDVLAPVAHAHANLVVHRDLKPANVLVTAEGHVKLLDFGIAKLLHADADSPTTMATQGHALTPAYAAPEQLTGGAVTTATDVYALGVLLYQLLTGRHPLMESGMAPAALVEAVLHREPLRASTAAQRPTRDAGGPSADALAAARSTVPERLAARLAGDLDTILAKALKKDPSERYPSVAALEADVRRYLRHEPVAARPDTIRYRLAKFTRRHRLPVALAATAFLALAGGLAGTITQARRATAQAERADRQAADATAQRDFARRQLARAEAINDLNAFLLADAAPLGKPFTARELLDRAERIVRRQADDPAGTRIDSLAALGALYWDIGEPDTTVRLLRQAHAEASTHVDIGLRARTSCELGRALVRSGDIGEARALIDDGIRRLAGHPQFGLTLAICHVVGASAENWAGDTGRAVAHIDQAGAIATREGLTSPLFTLRLALVRGDTYRMAGRLGDADAAFSEAYAGAVALGRGETESMGTLLNNWALVLVLLGRPLEAEAMFTRSIAIATVRGSETSVEPISWSNLARVVFELGRYEEAVTLAQRALREARARRDMAVADMAQQMLARAHVAAGRVTEGAALLSDVVSRYRRRFPPTHPAFAAAAIDEIRIAQQRGDPSGALARADRALTLLESQPAFRALLPLALRLRAEVSLSQGHLQSARTDALRILALTREQVSDEAPALTAGAAHLILGEVALAEGKTAEARAALAQAVRRLERSAGPSHTLTRRAKALLAGG
jgi:eukaryotic-like serine/threonine-protein kinase